MKDLPSISFLQRPESWVAVADDVFLKIPRQSNDPMTDVCGQIGLVIAQSEYDQASWLASSTPSVLRPLGLERACLIYPAISGPDMRNFLLDASRSASADVIAQAMTTLASIHATSLAPDVDFDEYGISPRFYVEPKNEIRERMARRKMVPVIDGFEVRNFRFDATRGIWMFFDPHRIRVGNPECDLARFAISLLMMPWGRTFACWIWTRFNLAQVITSYENAGGAVVDRDILRYFLEENAAMRDSFARKAVSNMRIGIRQAASAYRAVFFKQINNWIRTNGYGL